MFYKKESKLQDAFVISADEEDDGLVVENKGKSNMINSDLNQ